MDKVLNHFKRNMSIYLVFLACVIIIGVVLVINKVNDEKDTREKVDTSYFTVIDVDQALALFDDEKPKYLLISTDHCSATIKYVQTVNYAMIQYDFKVYYLSLSGVNLESENYKKLVEKLDFPYTLNGEEGVFGDFMGATPMNVFIDKGHMQYGTIGSMSTSALTILTDRYNISHGKVY